MGGGTVGSMPAKASAYGLRTVQKQDHKNSCVVAAPGNVTISTMGDGDTIDGEVVSEGQAVLLPNQTDLTEVGRYDVGPAGGPSVRAADFDEDSEVTNGVAVIVVGGATGVGTYVITTADPIIVGTTPIVMVRQMGAPHTHTLADITDSGALAAEDSIDPANIDIVASGRGVVVGKPAAGAGPAVEFGPGAGSNQVLMELGGAGGLFFSRVKDANLDIAAAIANNKFAVMPANTLKGNDTGAPLAPKDLTAAEVRTLLNVADGAEVNPDVVGQAEAEAGTATTERIWTAQRVAQAIAALAASAPKLLFYADHFDNPNNADWIVNALAPVEVDSVNNALNVRAFDDTAEEGIGFTIRVPAGATNMNIILLSRAAAGEAGVRTVGTKLYFRKIPEGAAISGTWAGGDDGSKVLDDLSFPATTEFFEKDVLTTLVLATEGIIAGQTYQFELTRIDPAGGTELASDWYLLEMEVEFT